ncbi:MAG: ATP-grasp domain-containing protein [Muribaculaceae bacterium]|nr:ATP-grasp domain-containing protein [Muribaculaceae bacterium]
MSNISNTRKKILILEGYCKQCLPFIRGFRDLGCEVSVLCGSKLDCCFVSRLPHHRILGTCDVHKPEESEKYILEIIKTGKYDLVFAPFDFSARILANHKEELSKYAVIYSNDKEVFQAASNKSTVMKVCTENNLPCPKTYFDIDSIETLKRMGIAFPIIIKPHSSYGARGVHSFESLQELESYVKATNIDLSDYVVQEHIPLGSQVMASIHFIDKKGNVKSGCLYKNDHLYPEDGGTSTLNSLLDRPDIEKTCEELIKKMNLKGVVGVDLMIDKRDDIGKVIEINARPPHSVTIAFIGGINLAQQILEDAFGDEVTSMKIKKRDFALRIMQTDILWFLSSPDRFKKTPKKLGLNHVKEQMFYWDDPLPWFAFLISGIKDYRKKMHEKRQ